MSELKGRCYCGAVSWQAKGPILWSALCHCEDCRQAASSDYVSWFGIERSSVIWNGPRQMYQSSAKVLRSFCSDCGSPLSFETEVFPEETHIYAATMENPSAYQPEAHIFWSERVPWLTLSDDLPKHPKGLQAAAEAGKPWLRSE
ncbi:glutathione-dependent formaldehyde-activating GFA [Roseibium sp. TrichSKD4]|uniref:GFA family protein n=1 Tax=Roseibium sp. TrichSKD4 TaxID=744980 RepID=UPI0001E56EAF|nr:GFA family protein [Roseibium sp. TrichSKD4]EFO31608.1 glutathione-dependent formaldehyde-activating GFA [Roseibium sp. TrichSKD4]